MGQAKLVIVCVVTALLSGCGAPVVMNKDSEGPGPDESVIVLGLRPDGTHLRFKEGTADRGHARTKPFSGFPFAGPPKDGYLVGKVKAGQLIILSEITAAGSAIGALFKMCGSQRGLVFEVPAGQIAYVTDVVVEPQEFNRLSIPYVR